MQSSTQMVFAQGLQRMPACLDFDGTAGVSLTHPVFSSLQHAVLPPAAARRPQVRAAQQHSVGQHAQAHRAAHSVTEPDLFSALLLPVHSYKVHVWVDAAREAVRIDFRGGVDKTYFIGVSDTTPAASVLAEPVTRPQQQRRLGC